MTTTRPIITILTDFGTNDGYIGTMKGVILGIVPDAQIIDISNQIQPQNILQAASVLSDAYRYFPAHTVHLVVVDPGVGSARDPIAMQTLNGTFVAPDNGVLTYIRLEESESIRAMKLDNPTYWLPTPSSTFHGRDIFSPAAAHLASGVPFEKIGSALADIKVLSLPQIAITPTAITGEAIRIDHFGNALTNIAKFRWVDDDTLELQPIYLVEGATSPLRISASHAQVTVGWHTLTGIHHTYTDVAPGQHVALIGSRGELEIALNQGNASETMTIHVGVPVTIQIKP
jgi:S-adenosylmethionine hydrolase